MKILKRLLITSIMLFTIIALIKPMNKVKAETTGNNGLSYYLNPDGKSYNVSKGTCTDSYVIIPSEYEGLPVTSIGSDYFNGEFSIANLETIELPSSIVKIKFYAFNNCTKLETVYYNGTIEDWCNIEFVGYSANPMFYAKKIYMLDEKNEWYEVTEVNIPDTINSIGDYQFYGFKNVRKITISSSVKSIGSGAFSQCTNLQEVYYNGTMENWCNYKFSYEYSNPMSYATNFYMLNENNEYYEVKEIEIPEGVTEIGDYQFYSFENIRTITIPSTIINPRDVSNSAFANCNIYKIINNSSIPITAGTSTFGGVAQKAYVIVDRNGNRTYRNYVTDYVEQNGLIFIKNNNEYKLIDYIGSEETVTLPLDINGEEYTIYQMKGVKNVIIPEGFTEINDDAFSGCTSLESVKISKTVQIISLRAFNYCTKLCKVIFEEDSQLTNINEKAFHNCTSLQNIEIPSNVIAIDDTAFSYCENLRKVTFEDNSKLSKMNRFIKCTNLESVEIPGSVISISSSVFYYAKNLKEIYYEGTIEDWCNISITSIVSFSKHLYVKNENNEYYEVKDLLMPESVTSIGMFQFCGIESMISVNIPSNITNIGDFAFQNCNIYKIINNSDLVLEFGSSNNGYIAYNAKIIIEKDGTVRYKEGVTEYLEKDDFVFIKENDEYKLIAYIGTLDTVTLPLNINGEKYIVYQMKGVKNVIIPNEFTEINDYAFKDCETLESIELSDALTKIGESSFSGCTSLKKISIPESVTIIGREAFYNSIDLVIYCEAITKPNGWDSSWNKSNCQVVWNYCEHVIGDWYTDEEPTCNEIGHRSKKCTKCNELIEEESIPALGHKYDENNVCIVCGIEKVHEGLVLELNGSGTGYILKSIGTCTDLIIKIPNTYNGLPIYTISANAFENADNLTKITIPEGFTSIGENAFLNCSNLETIVLPSTLKTIGKNAFYECEKLTNVYYGGTIESWCNFSFSSNAANPMVYGANFFMLDSNNEYCEVKDIVIPNTIKKLGLAQFYGFENLETIYIPSSITTVSSFIFEGCKNLTIHCERDYQPSGWSSLWNSSECPVVWSYCEHISSDWIIDVNATCINEGHRYQECTKCKRVLIEEVIEKEEHQFDELNQCQACKEYKVHKELTFKLNNNKDGYILTSASGCADSVINIPSIYNDLPVVEIYELAFNNLNTVERVLIPDTVTSINLYAFMGCTSLKEIVIPKSLTYISSSVFESCEKLENVYYTGTIADWCNIVFEDTPMKYAEKFYMLDSNNVYYEVKEIVIPDTITSIGNYQFYGFDNITKVTIPEGVTNIGHNAFTNCSNLISVDLPSTITNMGDFVFENCSNLKDIELPNTITSMGGGVFAYCESLEEITIPTSIEKIYMMSFVGCTSLKNIVIPDNIYSIDLSAFSGCSGLTNVEISDSVVEIENSAFADCISLTRIVIPLYVNKIERYAFYGCENLTIYCRVKSKPIGWDANWNFGNCSVIWSYGEHILGEWIIDVEPTCEEKGHRYALCTKCNELASEEVLDALGHDLVYYDKLDATCTENGHEAYEECKKCDYSTFELIPLLGHSYNDLNKCENCNENKIHEGLIFTKDDSSDGYVFSNIGTCTDTAINIPSVYNGLPVTSIDSDAFSGCTNLVSIEIPSSITSIGSSAFVDCSSLTYVYFAGTIEDWCNIAIVDIASNPMYGGDNFYLLDENNEYYELIELIIPNTVTSIGNYQFYGFDDITEVIIPASVKYIGFAPFISCTKLENLYYNGTIEDWCSVELDSNPMYNRENAYILDENNEYISVKEVKEISIPNTITAIGDKQFEGFINVTSLTIPSTINVIGTSIFSNDNLIKVYYNGTIEDWCNIKINTNPMYYGEEFYILGNDNVYYELVEIIIPSSIVFINDWQFYGFDNIKKVIIPNTITGIGEGSFRDCVSLEEVEIPKSTIFISERAFFDCINLKKITIGENVGSIGASAFVGCTNLIDINYQGTIEDWCNLSFGNEFSNPMYYGKHFNMLDENNKYYEVTEIVIPSTINKIKYHQFRGFVNLIKIVIPKSVYNLEPSAFSGCDNVTFYCEAESKPHNWDTYWNLNRPVVWGYKLGIAGDLDGNETVNTSDVIYLLMHTYFPDAYPVEQDCDYTGDGIVNTADVIHLLMHTYFPDAYPIEFKVKKKEEEIV